MHTFEAPEFHLVLVIRPKIWVVGMTKDPERVVIMLLVINCSKR